MENSSPKRSALDGVRVLELCSFVAGPYCAKLLADMGADVIKIECREAGDESRGRSPFYKGRPGTDSSLLFIYLNSNKRSIKLDINNPAAKDLLLDLVRKSDVVIEDLPLNEVERLGVDYPTVKRANPGVVVTSITPFGRTGPYRDYKAYYMNTYHTGGDGYLLPGSRLHDILFPGREPIKAGGYLGEYQVGTSASLVTMAALMGRLFSGKGHHIDVSKQEVLINLNSADVNLYPNRGIMYERVGRGFPHYIGGLYRCKDGFWEVLIPAQRPWEGLVEVMGRPAWTQDEKYATQEGRVEHSDEIDREIEEWASDRAKEEICRNLQQHGCAAGPVYSPEELLDDEQLRHRAYFAEAEHPVIGSYKVPSTAAAFSRTPWAFRGPAPSLGQHTAEVCEEWLGYTPEQVSQLQEQGTI